MLLTLCLNTPQTWNCIIHAKFRLVTSLLERVHKHCSWLYSWLYFCILAKILLFLHSSFSCRRVAAMLDGLLCPSWRFDLILQTLSMQTSSDGYCLKWQKRGESSHRDSLVKDKMEFSSKTKLNFSPKPQVFGCYVTWTQNWLLF